MINLWIATLDNTDIVTRFGNQDMEFSNLALNEELFSAFHDWRKKLATSNKIFALWGGVFFESVSVSCAAWDAQRTANWPLFMSSIKVDTGFLEMLYSWNRHNYSESTTEFLRDMECLSRYGSKQLENGIAFCNRSGSDMNYVSVGYALEMAHKDLKTNTKRLDISGEAWQRVHALMPFLKRSKEAMHNIFGMDDIQVHQKHVPNLKKHSYFKGCHKCFCYG